MNFDLGGTGAGKSITIRFLTASGILIQMDTLLDLIFVFFFISFQICTILNDKTI